MALEATVYDADIVETERRNGTFIATLRGPTELRVISRDPEHDLCFAMAEAGLPEGSIQFWRSTTPSLRYASAHYAAQYRIELGQACPYRRVRRRSSEDLKFLRSGDHGPVSYTHLTLPTILRV